MNTKSPKDYSDEIAKYMAVDLEVPHELKEGLIKSLITEVEREHAEKESSKSEEEEDLRSPNFD